MRRVESCNVLGYMDGCHSNDNSRPLCSSTVILRESNFSERINSAWVRSCNVLGYMDSCHSNDNS